MFNKFLLCVTLLCATSVQAASFEEMYDHSYVVYCNQQICNRAETGEYVKFLEVDPDLVGYIIMFDTEYSVEEIRAATPYLMDRHAPWFQGSE